MTPSEAFIYDLSQKSFLPFWSYLSPIGRNDKELCDVLVVCHEIIIVISVKDIKVSNSLDMDVKYNRWYKQAIQKSVKQIYGAERYIEKATSLLSKDGNQIELPKKEDRKIYRLAIAFGANKEFPFYSMDFGKGFVHVLDEQSSEILLTELDTIQDFVDYLNAKENLLTSANIVIPTESDLLALYIDMSLKFDRPLNYLALDEGMWDAYKQSQEYKNWSARIEKSYMWDEFVEILYNRVKDKEIPKEQWNELENSLRFINLENRLDRVDLSSILLDTIHQKSSARFMQDIAGKDHTYVFMPLTEKNWDSKTSELQMRCLVARTLVKATKIIGIAIGKQPEEDMIFDLVFLDIPVLDEPILKTVKKIQEELGYFTRSKMTKLSEVNKRVKKHS